jgi:putative phosphotransacetylase
VSLDPRIRIIGPRVRLTKQDFHVLFGDAVWPEFAEAVGVQDGFLAKQVLTVATPMGRLMGVPVLGPLSRRSGVECPLGRLRDLKMEPPVRLPGDFDSSPRVTLIGPRGHVEVENGIISLARTLQLSPENARRLALMDGDTVSCLLRSQRRHDHREAVRDSVLSEVYVSQSDNFDLELHIDEDDAAACRVQSGEPARLLLRTSPDRNSDMWLPVGRLVGENEVRTAREQNKRIRITSGMIVTPSARDLGRTWDIFDEDA